jgi:hypothetical protein
MCLSLGKNSLTRIFTEGQPLSVPNALKDRNEVLLVFPPETPTEAAKKLHEGLKRCKQSATYFYAEEETLALGLPPSHRTTIGMLATWRTALYPASYPPGGAGGGGEQWETAKPSQQGQQQRQQAQMAQRQPPKPPPPPPPKRVGRKCWVA